MSALQMIGTLLAIPLGIGSAYSMYRANFSAETTCQSLRANIVSMLDKSVDARTRHMLVRRDVDRLRAELRQRRSRRHGGVQGAARRPTQGQPARRAEAKPAVSEKPKEVARKVEPPSRRAMPRQGCRRAEAWQREALVRRGLACRGAWRADAARCRAGDATGRRHGGQQADAQRRRRAAGW